MVNVSWSEIRKAIPVPEINGGKVSDERKKNKKESLDSRFTPSTTHPFLYERAHDLLRTLGTRDEWEHLSMSFFRIANPPGTRASQHRERQIGLTSSLALLELAHMFEQCNVPCKRRVKNMCESEYGSAKRLYSGENIS